MRLREIYAQVERDITEDITRSLPRMLLAQSLDAGVAHGRENI